MEKTMENHLVDPTEKLYILSSKICKFASFLLKFFFLPILMKIPQGFSKISEIFNIFMEIANFDKF